MSSHACACRVGIQLPSVEVRFEDLEVSALAYAAGRELPSIFNAYRNWFEVQAPCSLLLLQPLQAGRQLACITMQTLLMCGRGPPAD